MRENGYAILIGNSEFPKDSQRLPPLRCPLNDVDDLHGLLTSSQHGRFTHVETLKDRPHGEILRKINATFTAVQKEDIALVYYSGHGKLNRFGKLHLATSNTEVSLLDSTSISADALRNLFRLASSNKLILILDCCYSGRIGDAFTNKSDVEDQLQQISGIEGGIYIIAASTGVETAQEKDGDRNSLFTKYLLEGIREGQADFNGDGLIDMNELYNYIYKRMEEEKSHLPVRWDIKALGSVLIIASAGALDEGNRRSLVKSVLLEHKHCVPPDIHAKALQLLEDKQGSDNKYKFNAYLNLLLQKPARIGEFINGWWLEERMMLRERLESKIQELYQEGRAENFTEDLGKITDILGFILEFSPSFSEASDVTARIQNQERLARLYPEVREHLKAGRWQQAVDLFKQDQKS